MKKTLKKLALGLAILTAATLFAAAPPEEPQQQICREYQGKTVCYKP